MSTPLEIAVTTREALRANADALLPVIDALGDDAAKRIATDFPDAWEIAIYAENDGAFYKSAVVPAIRFCGRDAFTLESSKRNAWLNVARGAIQRYRVAFCDKAWEPTPGTLETLTSYFWRVKYAEDIADCAAGRAFT